MHIKFEDLVFQREKHNASCRMEVEGWKVAAYAPPHYNHQSKFNFIATKDDMEIFDGRLGCRQLEALWNNFLTRPPRGPAIKVNAQYIGDRRYWMAERSLKWWCALKLNPDGNVSRDYSYYFTDDGWTDAQRVEFKLLFG